MVEYTIFEAGKRIGVDPYCIRQWEDEFDLQIRKNVLRQRYYVEADLHRLRRIKEWKALGMDSLSIRGKLKNK